MSCNSSISINNITFVCAHCFILNNLISITVDVAFRVDVATYITARDYITITVIITALIIIIIIIIKSDQWHITLLVVCGCGNG